MESDLWTDAEWGIFPITRRCAIGAVPSRLALPRLRVLGITDILTVAESRSVFMVEDGFRSVVWEPFPDHQPMPAATLLRSLAVIDDAVCREDGRILVHCSAGENRSPTILLLYYTACGVDASIARKWFAARTLDANPGYPLLLDDAVYRAVCHFGNTQRSMLHSDVITPAPFRRGANAS